LDGFLKGDDSEVVALSSQLMRLHIPQVVTLPDGVDYYDEIHNGPNVYKAIMKIFPDNEILKAPSDDYMGNKKLRVF
jgi:hypothetical protein